MKAAPSEVRMALMAIHVETWITTFTWTVFHCLVTIYRYRYRVVQFWVWIAESAHWTSQCIGHLDTKQCCQLHIYAYSVYRKFENFVIFLKCLVFKSLIWYIWKFSYIFSIFLSEGLVEILNRSIWFITKQK